MLSEKVSIENKYMELHNLLSQIDQEAALISQIDQTIQEVIHSLNPEKQICIWRYNDYTEYLLKRYGNLFPPNVKIVDEYTFEKNLLGINIIRPDETKDDSNTLWMILNEEDVKQVKDQFKIKDSDIVDISAAFRKQGLELYAPFYKYSKGSCEVLNHYMKHFQLASTEMFEERLRQYTLAAIEAKDFVLLEQLLNEYINMYQWMESVNIVYTNLKKSIIKFITARKQNDIILFWIDAVPWQWFNSYLPDLKNISKRGLVFRQVYTNTAYTHPTLRAMCSGVTPLDHLDGSMQRITFENSEMLQYLEEKNMKFLMVGHDYFLGPPSIDLKYQINTDRNASCNGIYWDSLLELIGSKEPIFLIIHSVYETHPPILSSDMETLDYGITGKAKKDQLEQIAKAFAYVDKRAAFYHKLFGDKKQIFMSDHGEHLTSPLRNNQEKLHAFLFAIGNGIQSGFVDNIFEYRNFLTLLKWMLGEVKDINECFSDYAVFQDTEIYNDALISHFIASGNAEEAVAYRGALSCGRKYVLHKTGKKYYYKIENDHDVEVDKSDDEESFEFLERVTGDFFPNIAGIERFQYTHRIYEAIDAGSKKGENI